MTCLMSKKLRNLNAARRIYAPESLIYEIIDIIMIIR